MISRLPYLLNGMSRGYTLVVVVSYSIVDEQEHTKRSNQLAEFVAIIRIHWLWW